MIKSVFYYYRIRFYKSPKVTTFLLVSILLTGCGHFIPIRRRIS